MTNAPERMNEQGTCTAIETESVQAGSRPVRYELIDKYGNSQGIYLNSSRAVTAAKYFWPDQEQDEDRTGKGWDVQVAGS